MKFAKELERDLVPEWRIKYLNYKAGKKYIKAVSRAILRANGTPLIGRRGDLPPHMTPMFIAGGMDFSAQSRSRHAHNDGSSSDDGGEDIDPLRSSPAPIAGAKQTKRALPKAATLAAPASGERASLTRSPRPEPQYGSFGTSAPAQGTPAAHTHTSGDSRTDFELPAPALRVPSNISDSSSRPKPHFRDSLGRLAVQRSLSMAPHPGPSRTLSPKGLHTPAGNSWQMPRQRLVRLFSVGSPLSRRDTRSDLDMRNLDEVRDRERDFFRFLDRELEKVETFYLQKEHQASERLDMLREQLHEMRDQRTDEMAERKRIKERGHPHPYGHNGKDGSKAGNGVSGWIDPLRAKIMKVGPNSKALQKLVYTPMMAATSTDERRDYTRRPTDADVPYRTAKRKLKLALQEFYRGLELLKSYALLNRTAFRKLNKKYDKAVNARPPLRYLNEKVNKAWFVNSDVLDGHITTVEDLYARYFESGNHKIAAGKLRSAGHRRPGDESASAFRNGLMGGIGLVFAIQGLTYGAELLFCGNPVIELHSSYLLQLYGGYFLMLYLFFLFCLDCHLWTINKVNYPFIFEFDPRHHLDWRQLSEFPSFFLLLLGVFMWLNFTRTGPDALFLWYPVILIGLTVAILCFPAPVLGHRSRKWFLYSHWRLLLAGIYPVEFRDFFLGDIYCSLTYAMANIELFFCLYATLWGNPVQCNSNHSRLLGFLSALPGIWRAFQCIRRYRDTKNVFPHLVNCGKYVMTIMSYVTLSMYRIDRNTSNLALFIAFSTINSIYCSIWDLFMDFSLLQPNSHHYLLRDVTALKHRWWYYVIMIVDPILRFAWIFYAVFTHNAQHSTIVSFLVSFAEVTRRGCWTLFRVENEHCANVAQYKASRDVPLPYHLEPLVARVSMEEQEAADAARQRTLSPSTTTPSARSTGLDAPPSSVAGRTPDVAAGIGAAATPETPATMEAGAAAGPEAEAAAGVGGLRRRRQRRRTDTSGGRGARSIRGIMALAHKQDYEKKRRPDAGSAGASLVEGRSDDDDDDDDASMADRDDDVDRHRHVDGDEDECEDGDLREVESLVKASGLDEERGQASSSS